MWAKAESMIKEAVSRAVGWCGWCTQCLGKYPMYAFSHGREASCAEFAAQGEQYCRACYEAEHTLSHLRSERCDVACKRRLCELLAEISTTASQLGERLYALDEREQDDQLATLQRVRRRLAALGPSRRIDV